MSTRLFRHPDGALPNTLALAYSLTGYGGGLWLMATASWPWALAATLWFAHALIVYAYLFHEFANGKIFTATLDGRLIAIDRATGKTERVAQLPLDRHTYLGELTPLADGGALVQITSNTQDLVVLE